VRSAWRRSKNSHSRTCALYSVARRDVVRNGVVEYAKRGRRPRPDRNSRRVRCHGDAADEHVVLNNIAADEIAAIYAGLIADENAARVVLNDVLNYRRVLGRHQVDALAAILSLAGLKI